VAYRLRPADFIFCDAAQFEADRGRWVTIGANEAPPGHKGGTPVRIDRGRIVAGPAELTGRKLTELKAPQTRLARGIREFARHHRITQAELRDAAEHVWQATRAESQEREAAKSRLRELTGLTRGDFSRLNNVGHDHTSLRGFDTAARTLAAEFPGLLGGAGYQEDSGEDTTDYPAAAWALLGEGRGHVPAKHAPEILETAAQLVLDTRQRELEALPFDERTAAITTNLETPVAYKLVPQDFAFDIDAGAWRPSINNLGKPPQRYPALWLGDPGNIVEAMHGLAENLESGHDEERSDVMWHILRAQDLLNDPRMNYAGHGPPEVSDEIMAAAHRLADAWNRRRRAA
jgi:hypothetical protein